MVLINGIRYVPEGEPDGIKNAAICKCGLDQNDVTDSRRTEYGIRRRRRCKVCGYSWGTLEISRMTQQEFNNDINLAKIEASRKTAEQIRNLVDKAIQDEVTLEDVRYKINEIINGV